LAIGGNYGATMTDSELLRAYVEEGSEDAFAALASRYVNLVYSAAVRQCNDSEAARDVAQAVFLTLARKASTLPRETILSGWLYRTARFVALEFVREETRRRRREEAMATREIEETMSPETLWASVSPHIDEAMEQLREPDRAAVLLRFFQGHSLREVGQALGLSDEAAKKRVARAIERLREQLKRRGITSSSSLLGTALAAHAVQSAPAAAAIVSGAAAGGAIAAQTLSANVLQMIVMTKVKTAVACAATALLMTGTATVSVQYVNAARENTALHETPVPVVIAKATDTNNADVAAAQIENRELQRQAMALHQLRSEVSQLRQAAKPPVGGSIPLTAAPPRFREAANTLRELQFEQFVAAGRKALLDRPLPEAEQAKYIPEVAFMKELGLALRVYASRNGDTFPVSLEELMASDLVKDSTREKLREGRYEYHVFSQAEQKPGLPAVWWGAPDQEGIRMMVMNDGSSHMIREPAGVEAPGALNIGGAQ
jgi:RNA polymerase sigma factor (sigma-70 family)